jgi:hypothetical protein
MKRLTLLASLLMGLTLSLGAQRTYEPNDGTKAPGTFTSKETVPLEEMNTSPNPTFEANQTEKFNKTLKTERSPGNARQAQEAQAVEESDEAQEDLEEQADQDLIDYRTTPNRRTTRPLGPNKR